MVKLKTDCSLGESLWARGLDGQEMGSGWGLCYMFSLSLSLSRHLVSARPCAVPPGTCLLPGHSPTSWLLQSVLTQPSKISAVGLSRTCLSETLRVNFRKPWKLLFWPFSHRSAHLHAAVYIPWLVASVWPLRPSPLSPVITPIIPLLFGSVYLGLYTPSSSLASTL